MFIACVVLTVLLLLETLPSAAADIIRSRPGRTRLDQLTRLGVLHGRRHSTQVFQTAHQARTAAGSRGRVASEMVAAVI